MWFRPFEKQLSANIRRVQKASVPNKIFSEFFHIGCVCVMKARQSDETPQPNAEKQLHKQLTGAPPVSDHHNIPHTLHLTFSQPLKKARRRYDVVALSVAPSRSHGGGRRREGQMVAFDAVTTHHILCENIPNIEVCMYCIYTLSRVFIHPLYTCISVPGSGCEGVEVAIIAAHVLCLL